MYICNELVIDWTAERYTHITNKLTRICLSIKLHSRQKLDVLTLYSIFAYLIDTGVDCKRAFIYDACTCILSTQEPDFYIFKALWFSLIVTSAVRVLCHQRRWVYLNRVQRTLQTLGHIQSVQLLISSLQFLSDRYMYMHMCISISTSTTVILGQVNIIKI